jgi:hypothetical protein
MYLVCRFFPSDTHLVIVHLRESATLANFARALCRAPQCNDGKPQIGVAGLFDR